MPLESRRETETPAFPEYPCILMHRQSKMLVLFSDHQKGCVVQVGSSAYTLGDVAERWIMEEFATYYGKLTLTQT